MTKSIGRMTLMSNELKVRVREYYLSSDVSYEELSTRSEQLFGRHVSIDEIKYAASRDPEGRWTILRANKGRRTSDVPNEEKLIKVADKLYELLIDEDDTLPGTAMAQIAKTWMEMLVKANLTKSDSSAKTSVQKVKDIFEQLEAQKMEADGSKSN